MESWSRLSPAIAGLVATLAVLALRGQAGAAQTGFARNQDAWARVLNKHVKDARVDYAGLKSAPGDLDLYLGQVAAIPPGEFATWKTNDRLALLLNLYNAQTLRLIIDHYPIASIRKIGLLPGAAWKKEIVRFGGRILSLDDLEHGMIRKDYSEPRIHFALVCAAKGCPPLREEPYTGDRLDQQLDDQARRFLSNTAKNRFDTQTGTLWLSPIFDWYASDFTTGGKTVRDFILSYLPPTTRKALSKAGDVTVRYTEYDWTLNDRQAR